VYSLGERMSEETTGGDANFVRADEDGEVAALELSPRFTSRARTGWSVTVELTGGQDLRPFEVKRGGPGDLDKTGGNWIPILFISGRMV
jgi:hypothetical protein